MWVEMTDRPINLLAKLLLGQDRPPAGGEAPTSAVRLYSPNPDAPTMYGGAPTEAPKTFSQRLGEQLSPPPINALWGALPPAARDSYSSLAHAIAEMSPGAAVRDTVEASGNVMRNVGQGNLWGSLGSGANLLTAMAGVLPGMRIAGSSERARNILGRPEFKKLADDQATAVVNALADSGVNWPSKNVLSSAHRLQTKASEMYPGVVEAPRPLETLKQEGRAAHAAWLESNAQRGRAELAEQQARVAADNERLRGLGLPEDIWNLPHGEQARALDALLTSRGIPYGRTSGAEGSRYFEIPTGPAEGAPTIKVRFADHANTSRLHGLPDYNITTSREGNFDAGNADMTMVLQALKAWGF